MDQRVHSRRGNAGLVVLFILLAAIGLTLTQAQRIQDWFRLRGYVPPADIVEIVEQTSMTDAARHLFYINRPALEDKTTFRQNCPDYEATIVIGCYRQGQGGIHVLRVTDPRLEGVEQVTAAHEMLHASYDRLSDADRDQVGAWLTAYARDGLRDDRIKSTLKSYEKTEPGEQLNEMYAIFGTEVADLPDELERHYARYFHDRQAVVRLAADYQEAFSSRQKQVEQYDAQLNLLNQQIKTNTDDLASRRAELDRREAQLNRSREQGDIEQYNAGVAGFNQQVNAYNALLTRTKALIEQHNRIVIERNEIAEQTSELRQAIDSDSLPAGQ